MARTTTDRALLSARDDGGVAGGGGGFAVHRSTAGRGGRRERRTFRSGVTHLPTRQLLYAYGSRPPLNDCARILNIIIIVIIIAKLYSR